MATITFLFATRLILGAVLAWGGGGVALLETEGWNEFSTSRSLLGSWGSGTRVNVQDRQL